MQTLQNTWDNFGQNNSFFSVITYDKYKDENLNQETLEEFYSCPASKACTLYIEKKLKAIKGIDLKQDFKEKSAVDFGCGVGRNLVHLSPHFKSVTGLDISQGLLDKAKVACEKYNINNATLINSGDNILQYGSFDLVFSVITLQHIPPPLMKNYLSQLMQMIKPAGFAFIHLPVERHGYKYNEEKCISDSKPLSWQMHILSENAMQKIIQKHGCRLLEFDDKEDHCGADWRNGFFIIEKPA